MSAVKPFLDTDSKGRASGLKVRRPFRFDHWQISDHILTYRLADKKQVFSSGDTNNRLGHTVTVLRVARAIAGGLELNQDLVSAIALGHDIAHCPYGHLGERVLSQRLEALGHPPYDHVKVAPFVLQEVGKLDLTYEVLCGTTYHSMSSEVMEAPIPNEYRVVAIADKSYVLDDTYDYINMFASGRLRETMLISPPAARSLWNKLHEAKFALGQTQDERFECFIQAVIDESLEKGEVSFGGSPAAQLFNSLRDLHANELYHRTDLPRDKILLERVLDKLVSSRIRGNPYLLFALLTDAELLFVDQFGKREFTQEDLNIIVAGDLSLPDRDDFSFLTYQPQSPSA